MYRLICLIYVVIYKASCELCIRDECSLERWDQNPGVNINIGINGHEPNPISTLPGHTTRPSPAPGGPTHPAPVIQNKQLENFGKKIVAFDKLVASHCIKNTNEVFEVYGKDGYTLEYKLVDNFKEEDIEVRMKHRVIHVKAFDHQQGVLSDIRVVADTLDMGQASWKLVGQVLQFSIPYKTKLAEKCRKICNNVFSNKTLIVASDDGDLSTFYRYGRTY